MRRLEWRDRNACRSCPRAWTTDRVRLLPQQNPAALVERYFPVQHSRFQLVICCGSVRHSKPGTDPSRWPRRRHSDRTRDGNTHHPPKVGRAGCVKRTTAGVLLAAVDRIGSSLATGAVPTRRPAVAHGFRQRPWISFAVSYAFPGCTGATARRACADRLHARRVLEPPLEPQR
jgi:hypothetical protein